MNRGRIAAFGLILIQAYLVGEYPDRWSFSAAAGLIALLTFWFNFRLRPSLHLTLAVPVVSLIFYTVLSNPPEIRGDWVLPGKYVIATCRSIICLMILELFLPNKNAISVRFAIFAVAGMLIAFCRYQSPNNTLVFLVPSVLSCSCFAFLFSPDSELKEDQSTIGKAFYTLALILCIGMGTIYLSNGIKYGSTLLRYFLIREVTHERNFVRGERLGFATTGKLDSVSEFQSIDPYGVALFVRCQKPPGYLRGRAFSTLEMNEWKLQSYDDQERTIQDVDSGPNGFRMEDGFSRFAIYEDSKDTGPFISVHVKPSERYIGAIAFTPLRFDYFDCYESTLKLDENRIIRPTFGGKRIWQAHVFNNNVPEQIAQEKYLNVPSFIKQNVEQIAKEVCSDAASDAERIAKVESYFRKNYQYAFKPFESESYDRISYFILDRPPAHCEYFATAAAVLLRLNGVPSRYVTGFVVDEYSEDENNYGDMWVGRNNDAHAWVEAFDRDKNQWTIVEATPGIDAAKGFWDERTRELIAQTERNENNRAVVNPTRGMLGYLTFLFQNYLQEPTNFFISILLIFLLYWIVRRERAKSGLPPYQLKSLAGQMRKIERKLKRLDLVRAPAETLNQFENRLRKYDGEQANLVQDSADFIARYAKVRYSAAQ